MFSHSRLKNYKVVYVVRVLRIRLVGPDLFGRPDGHTMRRKWE